ncbi:MAG: hypothetical protein JNM49_09445 [Flavobacteriales bacterium]|nr:hypothetical protein [Flavobacteriales bacterium]
MSKFNDLKVALAKQILESENESELLSVDLVMNHGVDFSLDAKQKTAIDEAHARFKRGEGRNYSSAEMVRRVRKIVRG